MSAAARPNDVSFYRDSAPYFVLMLLVAIPAFWPTYLNVEKTEADWHVHVHGVSLLLWAAMLIVQPWLIRRGKWSVHRKVGKTSYVLAPVIVISTLLLARYRLETNQDYNQLYFFFVQLGLTALFAMAYAQAIRHRKVGAIHARYMVCTALTMLDPIIARILGIYFDIPPVVEQVATYGLIDAILVGLWMRDRRIGNGIRAFPVMLGAFLVFEIGSFVVPQMDAWTDFAAWYGRLALP